ncbi:hypothetical protein M501DRAFT_1020239 [Patellaria atrata CBS 101060]|uniref:Ubiquitin 3 binding protein But2 C-terminal domain-containing protein n=1 Tax=Patellaria atrata CBS 101060 TaxID=1346257 RepID=A0A9P4S2M3_9PEZI|nr:hypothetical protein M501DRAFT_1020239 [Patellaria atrata CBS 101060]
MRFSFSNGSILGLSLLLSLARAATPDTLEIFRIDYYHCPAGAQVVIPADNSRIDITYGATGSGKSIAAYGPDVPTSLNSQTCYVRVEFRSSQMEFKVAIPEIDIQGSARLDSGTEATIETFLAWDRRPNGQQFSTLHIVGPKKSEDAKFVTNVVNTTNIVFPKCNTDGNPWTHTINLQTKFKVSAEPGAPASAAGELGDNTTLLQSVKLFWGDDCPQHECVDRDGEPIPSTCF